MGTTADRAGGASRLERRGALWTAQVRVMAVYVLLLVLCGVAVTVALREALTVRLEDRIEQQLTQEVFELQRFLEQERGLGSGMRSEADLGRLFDLYLERNVPSRDEAFATFIDGRVHEQVLERYPQATLPAGKLRDWERISTLGSQDREPRTGTYTTTIGWARYMVLPVRTGESAGAFVVASLPVQELGEVRDLQRTGFLLTFALVVIAALFSWYGARLALEPLGALTRTARSISRSDLRRRVPVTGRQEAAEMALSFNAMLDRLESAFEAQRTFLRETSHELRAPLTISIGQLDMLSDDPHERRRTVELVIDELQRAADIVQDLRVLAEAELPDFVRPEPLDVPELSQELIEKASALGQRDWELRQCGDGTLVGDRHRITEAVMNVAENAVRHTLEGDQIVLETSSGNGEVRLSVHDPGPGVPEPDRRRIFEPFERGRGAVRRYRGGGLGLAIVRAIAEAHGGRVELDSSPGEGATFTIVLPRSGPEDTVEADA